MFSEPVSLSWPILLLVLQVAIVQGRLGTSWVNFEKQKQASLGVDSHLEPHRHPYGYWDSPLSPEWMINQGDPIEDVFVDTVRVEIYYSERRPTEGGRNILRKASIFHDPVFDGPWDARTTAHEYGGGHAVAHNGTVYFSNLPDNRVYQVLPGGIPKPVTPARPEWRYADLTVHPVYPRFLLAIREDHTYTLGDCIVNSPVIIDTETGVVRSASINVKPIIPPQPRCDPDSPAFFDSPRFSPDGRYLIIRAWYHPYMSWESSEIWTCDVQPEYDSSGEITLGTFGICVRIGHDEDIALGEPNWVNATSFMFTNDVDGYINPWIYDVPTGIARPLLSSVAKQDFGEATWKFGTSHNAVLDKEHIFSTSFHNGRSELNVIRISDGTARKLHLPFAHVSSVRQLTEGVVAFIGSTDTTPLALWTFKISWLASGTALGDFTYELNAIGNRVARDIPIEYISLPSTYILAHPTTGEPIHTIYWPPTNPQYTGGLPGELPPVVVHVHGGPTDVVCQGLDWETQLFTSRGFGWLSVNYGGSMTYGVDYRKRLLGTWGVVDIEDSIEAVKRLGELGILDASRAVIRGGSAGGFTTFTALATVPDFFAAGTSFSGISDLRNLQAVLHKFESHYLLKYVGGTPETDPGLWWKRSPLSKAANIKSPLLIMHGAEDTIVPVQQAVKILETIEKNGGRAELRIFEGEAHGWRKAKTIQEALEKEIGWYRDVLRANQSLL